MSAFPGEAELGIESLDELFDGSGIRADAANALAISRVQIATFEMIPPLKAAWTAVFRRSLTTLLPVVMADVLALVACGAIVQVSMQFLSGQPHALLGAATLALLPLVVAYWLSGLY